MTAVDLDLDRGGVEAVLPRLRRGQAELLLEDLEAGRPAADVVAQLCRQPEPGDPGFMWAMGADSLALAIETGVLLRRTHPEYLDRAADVFAALALTAWAPDHATRPDAQGDGVVSPTRARRGSGGEDVDPTYEAAVSTHAGVVRHVLRSLAARLTPAEVGLVLDRVQAKVLGEPERPAPPAWQDGPRPRRPRRPADDAEAWLAANHPEELAGFPHVDEAASHTADGRPATRLLRQTGNPQDGHGRAKEVRFPAPDEEGHEVEGDLLTYWSAPVVLGADPWPGGRAGGHRALAQGRRDALAELAEQEHVEAQARARAAAAGGDDRCEHCGVHRRRSCRGHLCDRCRKYRDRNGALPTAAWLAARHPDLAALEPPGRRPWDTPAT